MVKRVKENKYSFNRRKRRKLIVCLAVLWACCSISADKNPETGSIEDLMRLGVSAENSHRPTDAAAAYEKLLEYDTTFEATIAPRLVNLYISLKQPARALSRARDVAKRHPDPKSYLAGIYSRLGQHKEAEMLLRQTVRETQNPKQQVPLLWQLAETQEKQGDKQMAMTTLTEARDATKDAGLRETSNLRIRALQKRLKSSHTQQMHTDNKIKAEGQP